VLGSGFQGSRKPRKDYSLSLRIEGGRAARGRGRSGSAKKTVGEAHRLLRPAPGLRPGHPDPTGRNINSQFPI